MKLSENKVLYGQMQEILSMPAQEANQKTRFASSCPQGNTQPS